MPDVDFRSPRLFLDASLSAGSSVALDRNQANYLGNVLRLAAGAPVLVFNGRDGEWQAAISGRKRPDALEILAQTRAQDRLPDVHYVFAPLKHARLDYMAQKAVEMGASALQPVLTRFTQVNRVNTDRMRANVIEAAEQPNNAGSSAWPGSRNRSRWSAGWASAPRSACWFSATRPLKPPIPWRRWRARGDRIPPELTC
jgi:16S rRNA U1498 N3-methylase RsmE